MKKWNMNRKRILTILCAFLIFASSLNIWNYNQTTKAEDATEQEVTPVYLPGYRNVTLSSFKEVKDDGTQIQMPEGKYDTTHMNTYYKLYGMPGNEIESFDKTLVSMEIDFDEPKSEGSTAIFIACRENRKSGFKIYLNGAKTHLVFCDAKNSNTLWERVKQETEGQFLEKMVLQISFDYGNFDNGSEENDLRIALYINGTEKKNITLNDYDPANALGNAIHVYTETTAGNLSSIIPKNNSLTEITWTDFSETQTFEYAAPETFSASEGDKDGIYVYKLNSQDISQMSGTSFRAKITLDGYGLYGSRIQFAGTQYEKGVTLAIRNSSSDVKSFGVWRMGQPELEYASNSWYHVRFNEAVADVNTFWQQEFFIRITTEFGDYDGDGDAEDVQLGFYFGEELYNKQYLYGYDCKEDFGNYVTIFRGGADLEVGSLGGDVTIRPVIAGEPEHIAYDLTERAYPLGTDAVWVNGKKAITSVLNEPGEYDIAVGKRENIIKNVVTYFSGDANVSKTVDVRDLIATLKIKDRDINTQISKPQFYGADVDGNGIVTVEDVGKIRSIILEEDDNNKEEKDNKVYLPGFEHVTLSNFINDGVNSGQGMSDGEYANAYNNTWFELRDTEGNVATNMDKTVVSMKVDFDHQDDGGDLVIFLATKGNTSTGFNLTTSSSGKALYLNGLGTSQSISSNDNLTEDTDNSWFFFSEKILQVSFEFVACDDDNIKNDLKLGLYVDGVVFKNAQSEEDGTWLIKDCDPSTELGTQLGVYFNNTNLKMRLSSGIPQKKAQQSNAVSFDIIGGKDVMPIGGGIYRPLETNDSESMDALYGTLKTAGINLITYTERDYNRNQTAVEQFLELGKKHGIGLLVNDSFITGRSGASYVSSTRLGNQIAKYANHPAFCGLYLVDEPGTDEYQPRPTRSVKRYGELARDLQYDLGYYCYMNMFPMYNVENVSEAVRKANYKAYVKEFCETFQPKILTWDNYPFPGKEFDLYFYNMSLMRQYAIEYNIPFWAHIQAGGQWPDNQETEYYKSVALYPNEFQFQWNVNTCLAFGVQGIQYFPLTQPENFAKALDDDGNQTMDYRRSGLIGADGTPNQWYGWAQDINGHIGAIDEVLMNAVHEGIIVNAAEEGTRGSFLNESEVHSVLDDVNDCVDNTLLADGIDTEYKYGFLGESSIDDKKKASYNEITDVNGEAMIGYFDYKGKTALYVVNYDMKSTQTITINFDKAYKIKQIENAQQSDHMNKNSISLEMTAGEGILLVLEP